MIKGFFLTLIIVTFSIGCGNANFGLSGVSQSFGQKITYNTSTDILVVVDNSGSMGSKQAQLSASFGTFIDYMMSSGFDFRIAVTTMDMSGGGAKGTFVGSPKVLTRSTPNLKQAFINNMNVGTRGSDLSRGLEAMENALSDGNLAGVNSGFFRPDALLAVLFLSDEDDGSVSNSKHYIDLLDSKKPAFPWGYRGWLANSIVVKELSPECLTYNQFSSPGLKYLDLSNASGGVVESICAADLVQATKNLRARIAEILTQYHLISEPNLATIHVFINGNEIANDSTNGWTYNPSGFTIMFHGSAVPPANANVQVAYTPVAVKH